MLLDKPKRVIDKPCLPFIVNFVTLSKKFGCLPSIGYIQEIYEFGAVRFVNSISATNSLRHSCPLQNDSETDYRTEKGGTGFFHNAIVVMKIKNCRLFIDAIHHHAFLSCSRKLKVGHLTVRVI